MDDSLKPQKIELRPVSSLAFDPSNPRLAEFDKDFDSEAQVIKVLWDTMDVRELVLSIDASGYFPHEPVIVSEENDRNVVIEGNRRLAAVKLLLNPNIGKDLNAKVPIISNERRESLREIPVLLSNRENAWRYLGFKHVNGPAKWDSYAKSKYIADVHRKYDVSLDDIAKQIGDTHQTVARLYRGLTVIEQAEREGVYQRSDRWHRKFYFSHLYASLGYSEIRKFLALRPDDYEGSELVPPENKEQLRELLVWIYGSRSKERRPVIQRQNPDLRHLDAVIGNTEALAVIRNGFELPIAYETSRPSSTIFEEALVNAKKNLEKARASLSTGYDHSKAQLGIAAAVADLAYDLHEEMQRKTAPRRRRSGARDA